jgi:hypothetical protein
VVPVVAEDQDLLDLQDLVTVVVLVVVEQHLLSLEHP